jgi:hypothetical protein
MCILLEQISPYSYSDTIVANEVGKASLVPYKSRDIGSDFIGTSDNSCCINQPPKTYISGGAIHMYETIKNYIVRTYGTFSSFLLVVNGLKPVMIILVEASPLNYSVALCRE